MKSRNKISRTVKLTYYLKMIHQYGFACLCLLATKQKININQTNVFEHQNNYFANLQVTGDYLEISQGTCEVRQGMYLFLRNH